MEYLNKKNFDKIVLLEGYFYIFMPDLISKGYKTIAEAVFYKTQDLYKFGGLRDWQRELFKPYVGLTYQVATEKGWRYGLGIELNDR